LKTEMIYYNKLVRDKIPQIIHEKGCEAITRVLHDEEFADCLKNKLLEETNEYIQDGSVEELADIYEVILAILRSKGVSYECFEAIRKKKEAERGAFTKKIYLEYVSESSQQ